MNLKEKFKKWNRSWYELSIEELKKKQKNAQHMGLLFATLPLLVLFFTAYSIATTHFSETTSETTMYLTLAAMVILFFFALLFLIYMNACALDYHRDKCDLNILIYLKQKLEVEQDGKK